MNVQREFGELPITFSTSNAICNFLGTSKNNFVSSKSNPVTECDGIWINVRTLARNILSAIDKDTKLKLDPTDYAVAVHEELEVIFSALEKYNKCKLIVYIPSYKSLNIYYPNANLFEASTDIQKAKEKLDNDIFNAVLKMKSVLPGYVLETDVLLLDMQLRNVAVLTHYPADLISFPSTTEVQLLESHTGLIKSRYQWYTKLRNGSSLYKIPFNRATLQIFGDNSQMFNPIKPDLRRALLDVAEQDKWTQFTSSDKIISTIERRIDKQTANLVKRLY